MPDHVGHDHVRHEHVDGFVRLLDRGKGGQAVGNGAHTEARPFQHQQGHVPDRRIVLDDDHHASAGRRTPRGRLFLADDGVHTREVELERRATAQFGVQPDVATGLARDPIDGRQAQSRALAPFLGRVERFEEVFPRLPIHADARVGDGEERISSRDHVEMLERVGFVEFGFARLDRDRSAVGHRVPRIDREVDEDLVELAGVDADVARWAVEPQDQANVLADEWSQHRLGVADRGLDVDDPWPYDLLATEGQELGRERRGTVRRIGDGRDSAEGLHGVEGVVVGGQIVGEQLAVATDREQHVVEVMGDAARQAPDRLELLSLEDLTHGELASRDVHHGGEDLKPARPEDRRQADLYRELRAVLASSGEVEADAHRPGQRAGQVFGSVGDVSGDPFGEEELDRLADQLVARVAEGELGLRVDIRDLGAGVDRHHRVGRGLEEGRPDLIRLRRERRRDRMGHIDTSNIVGVPADSIVSGANPARPVPSDRSRPQPRASAGAGRRSTRSRLAARHRASMQRPPR